MPVTKRVKIVSPVLLGICWLLFMLGLPSASALAATAQKPIVIGSKNFTESYILAELISQTLAAKGYPVERRFGLGGTLICYEALRAGEIDLYVEYTGTISQAILQIPGNPPLAELRQHLRTRGMALLAPLGFNNTYALALSESLASARGITTISDLREHADLRLAFSHEFIKRADGWGALAKAYRLPFAVIGIEHGLAYQAMQEGQIDVMDAYSTDGEIIRYNLRLLTDDLGFFPTYLAIPIVRLDSLAVLQPALADLADVLDESGMQLLNAQVAIDKLTFAEAVRRWRGGESPLAAPPPPRSDILDILAEIRPLLIRHLYLSGFALFLACLFGIPLAILIYTRPALAAMTLYFASLLQTIPSIALLALLIPLLGIGVIPAITALFFYALLPILRNNILGLTTVDQSLIRVSQGMGMTARQRTRYVTLPLALPSILAGIRTAAVISIGTATLAAFIGAGGLGEPIVTGLALNDPSLILRGAIPAVLLAIVTELFFELLEVLLIPAHLRRTSDSLST